MLLENNPYPQDIRVRREAEALVRAGHTVVVIAPRDAGQSRRETVAGVRVRRFRAPAGAGGAGSLALEFAVAGLRLHLAAVAELARGATVLHLHNPPDLLAAAGLLARLLRRRVVFDHHDLFPELVAEKSPGRALGGRRERGRAHDVRRLEPRPEHERVDGRDRARSRARARRADRRRAQRAAAGVDRAGAGGRVRARSTTRGSSTSARSPARTASATSRRFCGSLAREHDLPGARLTIVGDGDARADVERALRAEGVSSQVDWVGWVPVERIPELLAEADICIDPAPASELNQRSTMIKIAEYLTAGRPVVAYDLVETLRTLGGAGVVVAAGDAGALAAAVARLARDGETRAALSAAALTRAADLTWEHSERALLAAYAGLGPARRR